MDRKAESRFAIAQSNIADKRANSATVIDKFYLEITSGEGHLFFEARGVKISRSGDTITLHQKGRTPGYADHVRKFTVGENSEFYEWSDGYSTDNDDEPAGWHWMAKDLDRVLEQLIAQYE